MDTTIFEEIIKTEKNKRTKNIISAFGLLLLTISFVAIILYSGNEYKKIKKLNALFVEIKKEEEKKKLDSLIEIIRIKKVKENIFSFIDAVNAHDEQKYISFFCDSVEAFYLKGKASKTDIKYNIRWYWKTYPKVYNKYDTTAITICKIDEKNYHIILPNVSIKSEKNFSDIRSELKMNSFGQIYYIRDFIANKKVEKKPPQKGKKKIKK